jgi:multiple sugar transport system ATP-binding protein
VNDVFPKDRNIAMVFQSYALYPTMTVRRNMGFGLEMRGAARNQRDEAVRRAAELLQVEHLLDRRPGQLSGGQRQRVAMGRAIVRDPDLFLFDEPLSNLDAKLRVEMRTELKRLHDRLGATVVYVTHDQVEAMTLGSVVAVMRDGVVQQLGEPQTIYDDPANTFVAGFIGSPSMNLVDLRVGPETLEFGDGQAVSIGAPLALRLAGRIGSTVTLGVRPEAIIASAGDRADLRAVVDVVEPTGPDTLVVADLAGTKLTLRLGPRDRPRPGQPIGLSIPHEAMRLFDAATGERV